MKNDLNGIVSSIHPKITELKTDDYLINSSDYVIGIGEISKDILIYLPSNPCIGDQYVVKDIIGLNKFKIIIDGYGKLIDGDEQLIVNKKYSSFTFLYSGAQWNVVNFYIKNNKINISNFTWQNQGSATAMDAENGIWFFNPSNLSNQNLRLYYQNVPTQPYTLTTQLVNSSGFVNSTGTKATIYGIGLSDSNKLTTFHINTGDSAFDLNIANWQDETTFDSNLFSCNDFAFVSKISHLRLSDDGTNRKFSLSCDGINFIEILSTSNSDFLIPTKIGIVLNAFEADQYLSCLTFELS
jgi:hypothetical protein